MSHNPWPYVVVLLGSLGFLANTMAQQSNRFSNPAAFENRANTQDRSSSRWNNAGGGDADQSLRVRSGSDSVRSNPAAGLAEPSFGNSEFSNSDARTARADDTDSLSFDEFLGNRNGLRDPTFRRDSDPETAQIPIRPRTKTLPNRESVSPPVGNGRGPFPTNQQRNGFGANPVRRTTPAITRQNVEDARFDGSRYKTKESSLFNRPQMPKSLAPGFGQPAGNSGSVLFPFKEKPSVVAGVDAKKPTLSSQIKNAWSGDKDGSTAGRSTADPSGYTPSWFKWALFFSIGANLFFGYIAMNMHSRYQDLIEDMHASESRLERQRPRRRAQERDEEPISSRQRRRETEEAAFLQGGIEV